MALSPYDDTTAELTDEVVEVTLPSKTYRLNAETGHIEGFIDDDDALQQFIEKALRTARLRFLIYDDQYGSELEDLIGADVTPEYLETEIPQVISDALVYDDRISEVTDFELTRDGDKLYVNFSVVKSDGLILTVEEVAVNGN